VKAPIEDKRERAFGEKKERNQVKHHDKKKLS
jgi:hypothetical protein